MLKDIINAGIVVLLIYLFSGCASSTDDFQEPPAVADFTADIVTGVAPLNVWFADTSTNDIESWEWDFDNNGEIDSTVQTPLQQTFDVPGVYTVSLTVSGDGGYDTMIKEKYIIVYGDTVYVDKNNGNDNDNYGTVPEDAVHTIQKGIDLAGDTGWTVMVAEGTYTGTGNNNLNFNGKSIHLKSSGNCIIDCGNSARGFIFENGETFESILEGIIIQNGSADYGGGVFCDSSSPVIINCLIIDSSAIFDGGGIYCLNADPVITNCTITGNTAEFGAGIYYDSSDPLITNSIVWGNTSGQIDGIGTPGVTYSCIQDGYAGDGNISDDPLFTEGYGLQNTSACIDAGDNSAVIGDKDLNEEPRIVDGNSDYEELNGQYESVDMGALEYGPQGTLFFSEYIEGTSNNKALELYNASSASVDLSTCQIKIYANGSDTPSFTINLDQVMLAPGSVYVLGHTSFSQPSLCDQQSGWINFNGNDAVELVVDGETVDVFGQIGFDPGVEWGSGDTTTKDHTLRRKSTINWGDPDGSDPFNPAVRWEGFAADTFDGLGTR